MKDRPALTVGRSACVPRRVTAPSVARATLPCRISHLSWAKYRPTVGMQPLTVAALALAAIITMVTAPGRHIDFFPEDTLLKCMIPNPQRGLRGQNDTKLEDIPVIPFRVIRDPILNGTYFAPLDSGFPSPIFGEFPGPLRDFLINETGVGGRINSQLTSIRPIRPTTEGEAPARGLLPLRLITEGDGVGPIAADLRNRTNEVLERLDELGITDPDERDRIVEAMLNLNSLCEVMAGWVRLPIGQYFPQWLYASFCDSDAACSLPSGLTCLPVLQADAILHTIFLRWDCCWSLVDFEWVWECGWREVYVAHLGRCDCNCGTVFQNFQGDGYHTIADVGGESMIFGGNI